ncbi:hypothetical protein JXR93_04515 [bacterium]|nr:hypothetical protein [bacterium]
MKKIILFAVLISIFTSCKDAKDSVGKIENEKPLSKEEQELKERIEKKEREARERKVVKVLNDKNEIIEVDKKNYEEYENTLKEKNIEQIEETKNRLSILKQKIDEDKKIKELGIDENLNNNNNKSPLYEKLKILFKEIVDGYSLRSFEVNSSSDKIDFFSISFVYEKEKSKISFETVKINESHIELLKKSQKDFFYQSFKLGDSELHLSMNTKIGIINGIFIKNGVMFIVSGEGIREYFIILEILKGVNWDSFAVLKESHE